MGDDLTAARRFCNAARSDMTSLMESVCAQPCAAPDVLIGSLDNIQSSAKQMHARSIFRAAQSAVNAVNDRAALPTIQGRILSLNKLIAQYECGLEDIAPRPANGDLAESLNEPAAVLSAQALPAKGDALDLDSRYAAARSALAPLMGLTKQGPERDSLKTLAQFSDKVLNETSHKQEADISLESIDMEPAIKGDEGLLIDAPLLDGLNTLALDEPESAKLNLSPPIIADKPIFTQPFAVQSIRQIDSGRLVDFETLMPGFISQALQEARQTDKTVSVSYAADGVSLSHCQMTALQPVFNHIAKTLVSSVLERPEIRRSRGESGSGHIAITATQTSDRMAVTIECPGTAISISAFIPAGQSAEGLNVTPGDNAHNGYAHIVLSALRKSRSAANAKSISPSSTGMVS